MTIKISMWVPTNKMVTFQEVVKASGCYFIDDPSKGWRKTSVSTHDSPVVTHHSKYLSIEAPTSESYNDFNKLWEQANVSIVEKDSRPNWFLKRIRRLKFWK